MGFDPTGPSAERLLLSAAEMAAIAARRAERFSPVALTGTLRDRVQIKAGGGVSLLEGVSWGRASLDLHFRTVGPLWLGVGASVAVRELDDLIDAERALSVPVRAGARAVLDLPRAFFVGGGAYFELLLGERCLDLVACNRGTVAEPGALLSFTAGRLLSRRFGFDLEVAGGVGRSALPGPDPADDSAFRAAPRLHVSLGVFLRL